MTTMLPRPQHLWGRPLLSAGLASLLLLLPALVNGLGTFHHEGFVEEMVGSQSAFTGAFIPNPRDAINGQPMLLIASKRGLVHVMEDPDNSMETMEVLNMVDGVCTNGERGMQSIVPHPNFTENFYVYVYYTSFRDGCVEDASFGPQNRLSRFTMDPQTLMIPNTTEEILLEGAPTHKFFHNGGAIKFGNDGKLFVTTGDAGGDSLLTSQDPTNLHGSILRLNDDGTVPDDNPFVGDGGVPCGQSGGVLPDGSADGAICSEIFAYGLRNPFRIVMNISETDATHFRIHDVGGAVWEEISDGGDSYAGRNYGWPMYEGPCKFGRTDDCPLYDENNNVADFETFVNPLYYYEHRSMREGGAVTGGAFVPPGLWPPQFQYIYADFIFQEMYHLIEAPEEGCTTCVPPIPAYVNDTFYTSIKDEDQHENFARVVDMFFGPYNGTQALYIFKMGATNNIWRIRYTGSTNSVPVPDIGVDQTVVDIGEIVSFNGSESFDVDDVDLNFEWDFGDGAFSQEENPIHVYEEPGQYTVVLVVSDAAGQAQTASVVMMVGTPPTLNITSPEEGHEFFVGEIIVVSGVAFNSTGDQLDDVHISWEVRKHHADHWHPFLDVTDGNDIQLSSAPSPEDYMAATNSYLEIIMSATDSNGLVATAVREVYPRLIEVCIDSEPQGLEIMVDEYPVVTPMRITSWLNHDLRLRTPAQDLLAFSSWSDEVVDEDRKIRLVPNFQNAGIVAQFCLDSSGNGTCVAEARANENVLTARCPTDAPSAAPSGLASAAPSAMASDAPSAGPSVDVPEVSNATNTSLGGQDITQGDDDDEDDWNEEPVPERPHDESLPPPDEGDEGGVWDSINDTGMDDSAAALMTQAACILTVAASIIHCSVF